MMHYEFTVCFNNKDITYVVMKDKKAQNFFYK